MSRRPRADSGFERRWILLGALALAWLSGCGPASYIYTVTSKASRALGEAEAENAKKLAPYEYWSTKSYLQMAREKAGEADWELAVDYGRRAVRMGRAATRVSRRRARDGVPPDRPVLGVKQSSSDDQDDESD